MHHEQFRTSILSDLVDGLAVAVAERQVPSGGHTGHLLELAGKVGHAAVVCHKGNLREIHFAIGQQFFNSLDFLEDIVPFDGPSLHT